MTSPSLMKRILEMIEAEQAGKGSYYSAPNYGTSNSFNNQGNGNQDFSGANINSGNHHVGNRNWYRTSNNQGERVINNNGNFHGNGNGGFIEGGRVDFDSSTRNYYPGRYY